MTTIDEGTKKLVENHLVKADKSADFYRYSNISLLMILAVLGALIAADLTHENANLILGVLTAAFGALNKGLDPGKAGEKHTLRKRSLELIKIETDRANDDPSIYNAEQLKSFVYRAKHDPTSVFETLVKQAK